MPIAESPPNPTIQLLNSRPKFKLSYLGEMSNGQRGSNPKPLSRLPQGGEAQTFLKHHLDLENRHTHQPTSPLPIWEGDGGKVPPLPRLDLLSNNTLQ